MSLTDDQVRSILTEYADAYHAQKAAETLAESFKKQCAKLAVQLEPAFAEHKTLATDGFQLTRTVPESVSWDIEQALFDRPELVTPLTPFTKVSYDVKKAIDENPALAGDLAPYRSVTTGKPVFRATVKKA